MRLSVNSLLRNVCVAGVTLCLGLAVGLSNASAAAIFEDGFEQGLPAPPDNLPYTTSIPGWTLVGLGGIVNPDPGQPQPLGDSALLAENRNTMWLQGAGSSATKDTGIPWAPNTKYSVQLDYVSNTIEGAEDQLTFRLLDANGEVAANTPLLPKVLVDTVPDGAPAGLWGTIIGSTMLSKFQTATDVVTFTTGPVAPAGNVIFSITTSQLHQYRLDQVVISAVPVPEPGSLALLSIASLGLMAARRRRRCA